MIHLALLAALLGAAAASQPVTVEGRKATASASSQLSHKDPKRTAPANAFDGDPATAWVEGAGGVGKGQTLTLELAKPARIEGFLIVPGYAKSAAAFTDNAVPTEVALAVDGRELGRYRLVFARGAGEPNAHKPCPITGGAYNLAPRLIVLKEPAQGAKITLRIEAAEQPGKSADTAISELQPIFEGGELAVGKISYAAAAKALVALRAGRSEALPLAASPDVETILPMPEEAEKSLHADEKVTEWLTDKGAASAPDAQEAWVQAFSDALLGQPVAALGAGPALTLVGAMAFTHGDGEWVEMYPVLELDAQGKVSALRRAVRLGAAPGCREVLPTLR